MYSGYNIGRTIQAQIDPIIGEYTIQISVPTHLKFVEFVVFWIVWIQSNKIIDADTRNYTGYYESLTRDGGIIVRARIRCAFMLFIASTS